MIGLKEIIKRVSDAFYPYELRRIGQQYNPFTDEEIERRIVSHVSNRDGENLNLKLGKYSTKEDLDKRWDALKGHVFYDRKNRCVP